MTDGSGRGSEGRQREFFAERSELLEELTRRDLLARAGKVGLAGLALAALPAAHGVLAPPPASAQVPLLDGTLQAYCDTIIPGRKVAVTESGAPVVPSAIAGVDPRPGAVEADALAVGRRGVAGFNLLAAAFLADLEARALPHGGPFLTLGFDRRLAACKEGLALGNPTRALWELPAFIAFYAFAGAANVPSATAKTSVGYAYLGMPGTAPRGYSDASYRRALSRERTPKTGSLP